MKAIIFFILLTMLTIPTVFGQIKIGDNPQNIDPASVLELESTSKVLVITRVSTLEMEAITPQRGGMVYNTDTECINYYDGTQWVNLCDAVDFTITNDPIINNRATIEITQTADGYNLEIAKNGILGDNIVDGGIGPDDIQDNSITQEKLAAESVGSSEIRQNAVGSDEIRDGSIAPSDMANFIPGQVLVTDENGIVQWGDASDLMGAVGDEITITGNGTNEDPIRLSIDIQNEIDAKEMLLNKDPNIQLGNSDILYPTQNAVRTYVNNRINDVVVSGDGDSINEQNLNFEVSNGNLEITDIDGTLSVPLTDLNNQLLSINANRLAITNGNDVDLNPYLDNTDEQQLSIVENRISLTDGGFVDLPPGTIDTDQQQLTLEPDNLLSLTNDTTPIDLTPYLDDTDEQQLSINPEGTRITLTNGGFVDLPSGTVDTDEQQLTLEPGNLLTLENGGTPINLTSFLNTDNQDASEVDYDNTTSGLTAISTQAAIDELAGSTLVDTDDQDASEVDYDNTASGLTAITTQAAIDELAGSTLVNTDNQNAAQVPYDNIASGLTGATTQAAIDELAGSTLVNTDNQNAADVPFTPVGNTASTDVQAAITELQTDIDGISITGETNTASNQGTAGVATFIQKNGVDLEFRSVNAGSNKVIVSEDAINNEILVDIDDTNLVFTESQITDLAHTVDTQIDGPGIIALGFAAGPHTTNTDNQNAAAVPFVPTGNTGSGDVQAAIVELQTEIDGISAGGEVNTASNQGNAGIATFIQKNGVDLEFRSINAASNRITVVNDAANNEVDIDVVASNLAFTESQITDLAHTVDTQIDGPGIIALGFAAGPHTTNTDNQNAAAVPVAAAPVNYAAGSADVEAHLAGIDAALAAGNQNLFNTNGLTLTANRTHNLGIYDFVLSGAGNVAIGTLPGAPQSKLDVDGQIQARGGFASTEGSAGNPGFGFYTNDDTDTGMFRIAENQLGFTTNGIEKMRIIANGNVGIGVTIPQANLHVAGDVRADGGFFSSDQIIDVPDYVFQKYFLGNSILNPNYQFKELSEIEAFVKLNNHLPGIKSAAAIKEQGFWDLGEASRVNLEKIEELFLHTIEQEKKIKQLESTNKNMASEVEALKAQMEEIKTMLLEKTKE